MSLVAYCGNFVPEHSTENHVRQAFERLGHRVIRVQEGDTQAMTLLMDNMSRVDVLLWTRTADLAAQWGRVNQKRILANARRNKVPSVAFHLDRWWGLDREAAIWNEAFFECDYVITADGGHQAEFADIGINHIWMPPGVSRTECEPGTFRNGYASDLAFVGSWQPGYHAEWTHRPQLVGWLKATYPQQMRFWPRPGQPSIRGQDLRDLYASVKIVIGDSCLVGNATHYWSDRIPETIGRGGFLLHPYVEGLEDHFSIGQHLDVWTLGDWDELKSKIEFYLGHPEEAERIAEAGRQHVIEHHTYDVRAEQILKGVLK